MKFILRLLSIGLFGINLAYATEMDIASPSGEEDAHFHIYCLIERNGELEVCTEEECDCRAPKSYTVAVDPTTEETSLRTLIAAQLPATQMQLTGIILDGYIAEEEEYEPDDAYLNSVWGYIHSVDPNFAAAYRLSNDVQHLPQHLAHILKDSILNVKYVSK